MPDEIPVTPEVPVVPEATPEAPPRGEALKSLSTEELVELALKYRDEAAANRVQKSAANKQLAEDAKKWQEHLDAQKSEVERERDRSKALDAELAGFRAEKLKTTIAKKVEGFPMDLVEFIHGSDEDAMTASAKKLAKREADRLKALGDVSQHAGDRGRPVVPSKERGGGGFLESLDPSKGF